MITSFETYSTQHDLRQINLYETEYLYREIFEDEAYLVDGFKIPDAPVIFDIGANIGLFTMFMRERFPGSTIYAFEPARETYQCLAHNTARFGSSVKTFDIGVSDSDGEASFTFYPGYSVLSGLHTDRHGDSSLIVNSILHGSDSGTTRSDVERVVQPRFARKVVSTIRTRTLSRVIDEEAITKIDLLKIDAERAELAILRGIAEQHWPMIDHIVLEVHDPRELDIIRELLTAKQFAIRVEQEPQLAKAGIFNLYASR